MAVKVETLCVDDAEEDKSGPAAGKTVNQGPFPICYVLRKCIEETRIDANSSVLVVGGNARGCRGLEPLRLTSHHAVEYQRRSRQPGRVGRPSDCCRGRRRYPPSRQFVRILCLFMK